MAVCQAPDAGTVHRQQILDRRNQSIRITPLGHDPLPDSVRAILAAAAPLLLQPMIAMWGSGPVRSSKGHPGTAEARRGRAGPAAIAARTSTDKFRPAHSDMMAVGGEQVRPIRKQDILQFMQCLTKRGAGLFVFATAPEQACQVQPQDRS